jgi:acetate kinase
MAPGPFSVLAVNAGSSSIKFAVYRAGIELAPLLRGALHRIGLEGTTLSWDESRGGRGQQELKTSPREAAIATLVDWLAGRAELGALGAVGHRIVHGMRHTDAIRLTADAIVELRQGTPYAPDHLPQELALVETFHARFPDVAQVACFDTTFHSSMPRVARLLPLPRRYQAKHLQRYGFHGLSYAYLLEELARVAGPQAARERLLLAHLGNGASLAAVHGGTSLDTTMGFTPAAGLMMSTRTGDLDPGVVSFLARTEGLSVAEFDRMINHESGLLGVSGLSSDMRDLLAREADDARAAEAIALFCYQARKWAGAFAAVLGGLDTLVFSAGIGERSAPIRARICQGLEFLGVALDEARNAAHAAVISSDASRVTVRVIPTDEEVMIARSVARVLGWTYTREDETHDRTSHSAHDRPGSQD